VPRLDPDLPAKLYRSRAFWPRERTSAEMEEIGAGPLESMVRLVMTDPDGEFWPYRIAVAGVRFDGNAIVALDRQLREASRLSPGS
jgi:hypothetical protein